MGIRTVAVYSEPDRDSLHVRFADEAVCIGPAKSTDSYLNIPAIISAAEITDVEAIHPGYGFLSENAHFAEVCESCNITFIGPSPETIRCMGDKIVAKETMRRSGIPLTPGGDGAVHSKEEAIEIAKRIRYPVIIKAASGGGGKGMRICHNEMTLMSSFTVAQNEDKANFGNAEVYIEKYINDPRHIEFQIMADTHGNCVHLAERDCSVQRRHQKLIEEAPSPIITPEKRQEIGELAVKAARAVDYHNAGTIEFLMDSNGDFYFMEMNTRIQVEHPVTEMITGVDLVKEQIRVASGERLSFTQDDIKVKGSAIECRINAENPRNNFIPSPGRIEELNLPGGLGVRTDTHIYSGYTISPFYDSMVAKLIVHAEDRGAAIMRMRRALEEFFISPIKTTIPLHADILNHSEFIEGKASTHFLERFMKNETERL
jgi:acetyl-CoA carboxylase biotin carboxylase subunit